MKGQKEFVVEEVKNKLISFTPYKDNAILLLSNTQLESIKNTVTNAIIGGHVEYGKDRTNAAEVRAYARSMVMNHLKKAKELNGGHVFKAATPSSVGVTGDLSATGTSAVTPRTVRTKVKIAPKGVNPDILTQELKEYAKTLV